MISRTLTSSRSWRLRPARFATSSCCRRRALSAARVPATTAAKRRSRSRPRGADRTPRREKRGGRVFRPARPSAPRCFCAHASNAAARADRALGLAATGPPRAALRAPRSGPFASLVARSAPAGSGVRRRIPSPRSVVAADASTWRDRAATNPPMLTLAELAAARPAASCELFFRAHRCPDSAAPTTTRTARNVASWPGPNSSRPSLHPGTRCTDTSASLLPNRPSKHLRDTRGINPQRRG